MSSLEIAYRDWIKWKIEEMVQDDYGYDEEYREKLANYKEEALQDMVANLINNFYINEQINGTIEFMINKKFGGEE